MFKKFKGIITALVAVTMLAFVGCDFDKMDGTVEGVDGKLTLTVLTQYSKKNAGNAHYINPSNWTSSELTGLDFYIDGSSRNGKKIVNQSIDLSTGSGSIDLTYDVWELTLSAKNSSGDLVLKGDTFVDLTAGGTSVSFYLSTKGITSNGGVDLTGAYIDTNSAVSKITFELADFNTGKVLFTEDDDSPDGASFNYANAAVPAGTYTFSVTFYKGSKKIGFWSDIIRVAPGKTTEDDSIDCGVIGRKPAAPENLQVANVADSDSAMDGTYNVKLTWEDKSDNEENFVIYVYEYTTWADDTSRTLVKELGVKDDSSAKQYVFTTDSMRVSGSILSGHEECILALEHGKIYDFEIKSENCIGLSDDPACTRAASTDYAATATANIARTSITYNYNGAVLAGQTSDVRFYKYSGADIDVEEITGLVKNGNEFSKWIDKSDELTGAEVTKTTGANTLEVWASYVNSSAVDFTVEDFDENLLAAADVSAEDKDGNDVKGTGSVDVSAVDQKVTIAIANSTSFDVFQIRIDGNIVYTGTAATWDWTNFTDYNNGDHNVLVIARDAATKKWSSNTFKVTLAR